MDGTALIEMLRSMSQVGYSSGASLGNGPVAPPQQQQQEEPVSGAMLLPAVPMVQQPTSMAAAQPESEPGTVVPAELQPPQAEPTQHADVPIAAQMDSNRMPQDAPDVQPVQGTAEGRELASTSILSGHQMPEHEQPAQATSAAPPEQGSAAAQLLQQQQATEAPSVPEAAAVPQVLEAQAPTEQHEVVAPPPGLAEQPDRATERAVIPDALQQAEEETVIQLNGIHAETVGNASHMQERQDGDIMHNAGNRDASHIQAAVSELPELSATAEPSLPAAASHMEAAIPPEAERTVSHGSAERDQTAFTQQALPDCAGNAEHAAGPHPAPAECLTEQVLMAQDGSDRIQSQPGAGIGAAPEELESAAGPSAERLEEPAAAEHGHLSNGDMAEQDPLGSAGPMEADVPAPKSAKSASLAIHAAYVGPDSGSAAVQAPDVQMSEDEVPGTGVPQEEPNTTDDSSPAIADDAA